MKNKWWLKPLLVAVASYAVILPWITFAVGWSRPVVAVLIFGFVMGCWWAYDQRPKS